MQISYEKFNTSGKSFSIIPFRLTFEVKCHLQNLLSINGYQTKRARQTSLSSWVLKHITKLNANA